MQATLAVHNRRPLPRIPTPGKSKKANEMHPISAHNEVNCGGTRTPRLPLSILNRSTRSPPTPNSNAKRTETASLSRIGNPSSLYSHSNHSGDLLSGSRSPTALVRSNPTHSIPTRLDLQRFPLQIHRRLPPTSLLRSRRKLWKKYWLVVDLATIPELSENIYEIEIESVYQLRSRSGKVTPRKPPPSELQSTPTPIVRPLSKHPPRAVTMPPPPELDDDTGSESSSSDEDLDAYEFDLSCMEPSMDTPTQQAGRYDKPKDSCITVSYSRLF